MRKYILTRLGLGFLTLILMATLIFFLQNLIPANPIPVGKDIDAWREQMKLAGLEDSVVTQFFKYVKRLLIDFSWGKLYGKNSPVWNAMTSPILYSIILTVPAFILSIIIGVPLGILAANYRGRWPDVLINIVTVTLMAIPAFALIIYFSQWFSFLPVQFRAPGLYGVGGMLVSYILPISCLTLTGIAPFVYYTRNEMVEVLQEDYIQTAQTKGLKWRTVLWKHGFRNGMIPVITLIVSNFFILISGSFVIEGMFNIPGIANQMVSAVTTREINQIMFIAIFFGGLNFVGQLLTDISYAFVDPRITYGTSNKPSIFSVLRAKMIRSKKKRAIVSANAETNNSKGENK